MNYKLICFLLAEAPRPKRGAGEEVKAPSAKHAPHYFEASVPRQSIISQEKISVGKNDGTLFLKMYRPDIMLAEARFELDNLFSHKTIEFKEEVAAKLYEILKKKNGKDIERFSEEYSVYAVSGYQGDPEQFLAEKSIIASLLKSEKIALDPLEIDYTLSSFLKYAKNDMVIVDWDGAIIFDPSGDIESTIELLQLANFQLLSYRLLDKELDSRLHRITKLILESPDRARFLFGAGEINQAIKSVVLIRSSSISEFQTLEKEIKLIGDWYSARLFDLVAKKFKIEDWRRTIKDKLEALEDVYIVASERFTNSWARRGKILESIGWSILIIGWIILLFFDFYNFFIK
ncbi:MAG: hypothetical protein AAB527_01835 [Patescibacteria group bacterium]